MLVQLKCRRNTLKSVATELFSLTRLGQTCNPAALRSEPAQLEFCPIDQQHYRSAGHIRYCISLVDKETCRVQFILDISECYAWICDWSRQIKYFSNLHKSPEQRSGQKQTHTFTFCTFHFHESEKKDAVRMQNDHKIPRLTCAILLNGISFSNTFFFFRPAVISP